MALFDRETGARLLRGYADLSAPVRYLLIALGIVLTGFVVVGLAWAWWNVLRSLQG